MSNVFEYAVRNKVRFPSPRGLLSAESLWDVPLRSTDGFNLNEVAKTLNRDLKALSEESFVDDRPSPDRLRLEQSLEAVKHVIQTKLDEEQAVQEAARRKQERERLTRVLAQKEDEALENLTEQQIRQRLRKLEDK